jgi:polysaccharide biosynthesis protein PslH
MNILLLSPYPPYPPYGGGTMRIYQIARGLARRHRVTCLTFAPDEATEHALAPLREICRVVTVRGPEPRSTLRRAWTTLASPLPDMALRNASRTYTHALGELLGREPFDVAQAESIEMASYLTRGMGGAAPGRGPLLVLDQFNAEYVLQRRTALTSLGAAAAPPFHNPRAALRNLAGGTYSLAQWGKLAAYERRVMRRVDAVVAVSEEDTHAMRRLAPAARFALVPNGVDTRHFSREGLAEEGAAPLAFAGPTLVFSGTLDYRPNVDALVWFVQEVLPRIRQARPGALLLAVGKRPAPVLRQLADQGRLALTGEVADARPFIAGAAVYVVPMRIGGGIRLKLLEALSLEAPTVSTTLGAEGITGLRDQEHCLLADAPEAFARAVLRLLDDPALGRRLARAGRAFVGAGYDWDTLVPRLERLYDEVLGGS